VAIKGPCAQVIPLLNGTAGPPEFLLLRIILTGTEGESNSFIISTVLSVEQSSMTTISAGGSLWATQLFNASSIVCEPL
jgi:hypothetical protein